jgi:zinc protease
MTRSPYKALLWLPLLLLGSGPNLLAQSGRGRPTTPPPTRPSPRPGAPPTTVLNVPEGGRLARQDVEGTTNRYVLRNGLTVIIRERHAQPLVAVNAYVRAGSLHEADDQSGLAAVTARALLKGNAARGPGEIRAEAERLGGVLRAETSYEYTAFNISAPSESLNKVLALQFEMLQGPAFVESEVRKAVDEVRRDGRRAADDGPEASRARLLATAFTTHRLRRGMIDPEASLANVARDQVVAFHQSRYQPQNVILVISGDVFAARAIGPIQLLFGKWAKGAEAPVAGGDEPAQDKLRYSNSRSDLSLSYINVAYHVPGAAASREALREQATLDLLAAILGLGRGSRLARALRESEKAELTGVVSEVAARYRQLASVGLLEVQMRVLPDRIDRAEAEYFRTLESFRREVPGAGELQRARYMLEKRYYDSLARHEDEAARLAWAQATYGDYRVLDSYLARLAAVTAAEVQAAAAKYLTLANTTVHESEPRTAQARTFTPENFTETMAIFAPTLLQPLAAADVKPAVALKTFTQGTPRGGAIEGQNIIVTEAPLPVKDFSILRGARAFVREDRSQPLLSVGVYFQGGRLIEDAATSGMTELMLRSMLKSTTARKSDLIALELESYGGEIRLINEPDFFGYTLDVLSRNAEAATKLMLEIIEQPYFEKAEIARESGSVIADQLAVRDDARARPRELMLAAIHPGHPYGLPRYGLPGVVRAATAAQLEAWHAKTIQRQFPLVVLVGDTDGSALVSRIFSEAFKRREIDQALRANLPALSATPDDQTEARARAQTSQAIGLRTPAASTPDHYALELIARFAAGGRFESELRERRAIADEAWVANEPRLASGVFYAYAASAPEHEQRVRDALLSELGKLAAAPPSESEFERGRNAAIGAYALLLETHPERALEYGRAVIFGRRAADVDNQPEMMRTLKSADLKRVAEAALKTTLAGRGVVRGEAMPKPAVNQ